MDHDELEAVGSGIRDFVLGVAAVVEVLLRGYPLSEDCGVRISVEVLSQVEADVKVEVEHEETAEVEAVIAAEESMDEMEKLEEAVDNRLRSRSSSTSSSLR